MRIILLMYIFGITSLWATNIELTQKEKEYLKENVFTYAGDPNWLPFEAFNSDGKYIGIVSEYIDIIENKLDLKLNKMITKDWIDTLELSKKVGVDIISGDARDMVLRKNYKAIDTYIKNSLVLVARENYIFIDTLNDLNDFKDKKIAFIDGAGFKVDIYKKYPDINFINCKSPQDGLLGVKSGKYDIFIGSLSMIEYTINDLNIEGIKVSGTMGTTMNLTLFVDKNKPILYSIINRAIHSITDIQKKKIISKWKYSLVEKVIIDYTLVGQTIGLFLFLLVLSIMLIFRNNNKKLHQLLNSSIDSLTIFKNGRLVDTNRVTLDMYGYNSVSDVKNKRALDLVHPSEHSFLKKQLIHSQKPYELLMMRKDGSTFPALVQGTQIDKTTRVTSVVDLTEIKNIQKKLEILNNSLEDKVKEEVAKNREKDKIMLQQSRLAQMGEMISMIAHQWKQPLSHLSILGQGVVLKYKLNKLDDMSIENFNIKHSKQIIQMSDTIDDFRNFFRPQKEKKIFNMIDTIKHSIDILSPSFEKENIILNMSLSPNCYIDGYSNELGQGLINILNNAKDALVENKIADKIITITLEKNEQDICLIISDNAGGIPSHIIDKVFDPYFSTKNKKNGTGLGLYMTKIIIHEHLNGNLSVFNDKDGAVFRITVTIQHPIIFS